MCRSPIILTLLAAALLAPQLYATDYHVATQASGASDSNNGRSASVSGQNGPWNSIRRAIGVAGPGDVVHVHSGDYRSEGTLRITRNGNSSSPIHFKAAAGATATVQGFAIESTSWIVVEGFTLRNRDFTLPSGWRDMPNTVVNDAGVQIDPDESWSSRLNKIRSKYSTYMSMVDALESSWRTGIDVKSATDVVLRGNDIAYYTLGFQLRNRSARITVENNRIHHNRTGLFTWRSNPSLSDSDIVSNHFYQNLMDGVDIREEAADIRVTDNVFEYHGTSHISVKSGSHHTLVKGNIARYGGYYTEAMENPGSSAINYHTAGVGNVADGNFAAYHVDPTQLDGNGFILDLMGTTSVKLQNNIAYRNAGSGITTTRTGYSTFVNNSLIENGYGSSHQHNGAGIRFAKPEDRGHIIANNIFVRNRTAGIWTSRLIGDAAVVDGNLYDQSNSALIWDSGSRNDRYYTSLQAVRSGTGREDSGMEGDPGLVSGSPFGFKLGSTSPARSAGLAAYAPISDFEGDIRDSSPDIGHDEVSVLDSTPPTVTFVQPNGAGTEVEVDFSEAVSAGSAASVGNYSLNGGGQVTGASMAGPARVRLATSNLVSDRTYVLSLSGVQDLSGNRVPANHSAQFNYVTADEMVLQASSANGDGNDAELSGAQPTQNFGSRPSIELRPGPSGSVGLLSWDVDKIPAGAHVVSAEIEVEVTEGASGRVEAFGVLRDWDEGATNWMKASASESWSAAGAAGADDRSTNPAGLGVVSGPGPMKIRLGQAGVSVVQAWVDGSAPNHGMIATLGGTSGGTRFVSREGTTAAKRPRLTIRYESTETPAPAAPTALHLVETTTTSVRLAWDFDGEDSTRFRVYRDGAAAVSSSTPSYTATGLTPDTAYNFRVTAIAADGTESEPSNSLSARTEAAALGVPTNLRVVSTDATSISLAWNAPSGMASGATYRVYRDGSAGVSSSTPSYNATGLTPNTAYNFRVTVAAPDGSESEPSSWLLASTASAAVGAPTTLRVVSTETTSISLAWNAPSGMAPGSFYLVYRDGAAAVSASSASHTATGLTPNTAYNFRVTAVSPDKIETAASNSLSARTESEATLEPPRNLRVVSTETTHVMLEWSAPSGSSAGAYRVYRDGAAAGETKSTEFRANGLTPGKRYSFAVKSIGADGESAASNTVTASTEDEDEDDAAPVVKSMNIRLWKRGRKKAGRVEVVLVDSSGRSVSNATLKGQWTINGKAYGRTVYLRTRRRGVAQDYVRLPSSTRGVVGFVVTYVKSSSYRGPIGPYTETSKMR